METQHPSPLLTVSEIDLIYKSKVKASCRPHIKSSVDAYTIFMNHWDTNKIELVEQFKVMFLNRANRVLGIYEASSGGTTGTVVDIRLLFTGALKSNAVAMILCHNHPSGNTNPSDADLQLTKKICEAGRVLDIQVLDHVIITPERYYSLADEGNMS